jgi:hypothetical protein
MIADIPEKYNRILLAVLGSKELIHKWWASPNRSFGNVTPIEMWDRDQDRVKKYLLAQLSGEYS